MTHSLATRPVTTDGSGLLQLGGRSAIVKSGAVLLGTLFLALSSQIEVPMVPVPMTMQTFAVALIGALYGARLGTLTVLAWLGEAALGLPVLAGGAAGLAHFAGPTAGYLAAFPIMAGMVGLLAERGWDARRPLLAFAAMLAANALCLVMGGAWLAALIGPQKALALGVAPFVLGGVLKSALGAATLVALARAIRRTPRA
ncbi:biotin transporter BioY [Nitratireductor sp. ZSWI3]|uniref:biotin transporter BioY n=1 Tax=Nitratireductor sp. ZSWI3 TaxID=2966359 RepID=UPI00214FCA63|nr:biotin transporter BioY [Nitratireductor sp. ZSWI3]MCR4269124.1 biotin transporter BioY [Nitratireductor sp. ZSWI3]